MVDIKIMAHPKRAANVSKILKSLNLADNAVVWDDRPGGGDAMYTARKTWLHSLPMDATHRMVLQDDVEVCENFVSIINSIAETHPCRAFTGINFLCPSNYPNYNNTPYYRVYDMPGCAIMLPEEFIKPCMQWCAESTDAVLKPHDDLMISKYCREHNIMMITSFPCIVQHPDNDTLFKIKYNWKRTSRFYDKGAKADWGNKSILPIK